MTAWGDFAKQIVHACVDQCEWVHQMDWRTEKFGYECFPDKFPCLVIVAGGERFVSNFIHYRRHDGIQESPRSLNRPLSSRSDEQPFNNRGLSRDSRHFRYLT